MQKFPCLFILLAYHFLKNIVAEIPFIINQEITLNNLDQTSYVSNFQMSCQEKNPDILISVYCLEHEVDKEFCKLLYQMVMRKVKNQCQYTSDNILLLNKNLSHRSTAISAETKDGIDAMLVAENIVVHEIIQGSQTSATATEGSNICIIHSCSLRGENNVILHDILHQIQESNLIYRLDKLIVLNYGVNIADKIYDTFPSLISWFHVSNSTSFSQVPTLRIIQKISQHFSRLEGFNTNVLYLHTEGVSYSEDYLQVADWRNLMLYFLATKHMSCYHLLESKEFDVIGVNYLTYFKEEKLKRMFDGNYWWSTSTYLSFLPLLPLDSSTKHDAECWLLTERNVRVYVPYSSNISHTHQFYPKSVYVDDGTSNGNRKGIKKGISRQRIRSPHIVAFELEEKRY